MIFNELTLGYIRKIMTHDNVIFPFYNFSYYCNYIRVLRKVLISLAPTTE